MPGHADGDICVWNMDSGTLFHTVEDHADVVTNMVQYKNKLVRLA